MKYRVFYTADGYKSETIVEAASVETAKLIVERRPSCKLVTGVIREAPEPRVVTVQAEGKV